MKAGFIMSKLPLPAAPRKRTLRSSTTLCAASLSPPPPKRQKSKRMIAASILEAEKCMSDALAESFANYPHPVTHAYDPLQYAWNAHEWYVNTYGNTKKKYLLVGMNPGPWGMAQTGVPFGQIEAVKSFLNMPEDIEIGKPERENAARPVTGLSCGRSEVSGKRLWLQWIREEFHTAEAFFERFFVHNYCPLMFLEKSGKNRTPVQLRKKDRDPLLEICDEGLREIVNALEVKVVIGIGGFAEERCKIALKEAIEERGVIVERLLHPSPASPASVNWAEKATAKMKDIMERAADGGEGKGGSG